MAKGVVDVFEMIQVNEHQRQRLSAAVRQAQGLNTTVFEEQPVRQAGERVKVRELLDLRLRFLLFKRFFLQLSHGSAELLCARLHQLFQAVAGVFEFKLRFFPGVHVQHNPDRALAQIVGVDGFGTDRTVHGQAIFSAQHHFCLDGLAGSQGRVTTSARVQPIRVAQIPSAGGEPMELAWFVPENVLKLTVAPGEVAVMQEHDAKHHVIENQFLFGQAGLKSLLRLLFFVNVVNDPDRPLACVGWVDQLAGEVRPEQ